MYARSFLALGFAMALVVSCTSEDPQTASGGLAASSGDGTSSGASSGGASSGGASSGGASSGGSSSGGSAPTPPGAEPSDPALNGIVAAHNAVRASVSPPASTPIPNLNWSDTDAAVAKAWAAKCKFEHNPGRGNRGENIYASGGGTNTPKKVVDSWASEKANYNYANNSCSGVCGHYTQVVWAKTTTLGCAVQKCSGAGGPFGNGPWEFWVCDYSPPGNFNGLRPY